MHATKNESNKLFSKTAIGFLFGVAFGLVIAWFLNRSDQARSSSMGAGASVVYVPLSQLESGTVTLRPPQPAVESSPDGGNIDKSDKSYSCTKSIGQSTSQNGQDKAMEIQYFQGRW